MPPRILSSAFLRSYAVVIISPHSRFLCAIYVVHSWSFHGRHLAIVIPSLLFQHHHCVILIEVSCHHGSFIVIVIVPVRKQLTQLLASMCKIFYCKEIVFYLTRCAFFHLATSAAASTKHTTTCAAITVFVRQGCLFRCRRSNH